MLPLILLLPLHLEVPYLMLPLFLLLPLHLLVPYFMTPLLSLLPLHLLLLLLPLLPSRWLGLEAYRTDCSGDLHDLQWNLSVKLSLSSRCNWYTTLELISWNDEASTARARQRIPRAKFMVNSVGLALRQRWILGNHRERGGPKTKALIRVAKSSADCWCLILLMMAKVKDEDWWRLLKEFYLRIHLISMKYNYFSFKTHRYPLNSCSSITFLSFIVYQLSSIGLSSFIAAIVVSSQRCFSSSTILSDPPLSSIWLVPLRKSRQLLFTMSDEIIEIDVKKLKGERRTSCVNFCRLHSWYSFCFAW